MWRGLACLALFATYGCGSSAYERIAQRCVVSVLVTDPDGANPRTIPLRVGTCPTAPK